MSKSKPTFAGFRASEKPRCSKCAGFLPETAGHNRAMCPNCSAPNTWYVKE